VRNFLVGLFTPEVRTAKIDSDPPGSADILMGTSINANGKTFYGFPTPVNDDWAATKQYVDRDGKFLPPVNAATNTNITLSAAQTVDGVALVAGNRCLVKNQTTSSQNGVYVVAAGAWTRATDADTAAELTEGTQVRCLDGGANRDKTYTLLRTITTVGTDAQEWRLLAQLDAGGAFGYPLPTGVGHLYYDDDNKVIAVWDGGTWDRAGHPIICTSTTRPAFPANDLLIYETDTGLAYIYSGGAWVSFGGGPEVYEEGVPVVTNALGLNFVGAGVTATNDGLGNATVTIPGGSGGGTTALVPVRQVFTASGSYVKPAGLVYAEVECQGGGGGGSGVSNSTASTADAGSSGGGGGYNKKIWLASDLSATETVTVGTGGTGGPATDAGGGAGVASSFKTQIANGGGGGGATGNVGLARSAGGAGGGASGGDFTVAGGDGPNGAVIANGGGTSPTVQAINGGASFLGGACRPGTSAAGSVGVNGQAYGGGGGGGYSRAASGAFAGGAGGAGVVIVTSYMPAPAAEPQAPVGSMMMWPTATAPTGWLLCNGSAIPAGNTALIALIGANTPDLRGRFPIGAGTFAAVGAGDASAESARTPVHAHGLNSHTHTISGQAGTGFIGGATGSINMTKYGDYNGHAHGGDTGAASGNTASSSVNGIPYLGVNFIIKT
jgi:hypothetical protein